jgi:ketosteroid isomerase-like protein
MNRLGVGVWLLLTAGAVGMAGPANAQSTSELAAEVRAAEEAFAATMAARDLDAFRSFLAEEAVFSTGEVLRGAGAIVDAWSPYFEGPAAPFSWAPEEVVVLDSGTLALSSGPVFDPEGDLIGAFNSVWRLEPDGRWRVIFDKGCP